MKGFFIAIDGTDGSGKKTQTNILVKRLSRKGHDVRKIDFPQYGNKSAALVEEYLNGKFGTAKQVGPYRASIFYAVDRYAAAPKIRKWLEEGKIIVSNRYVSANMGHQAGKIKNRKERDKFLKWLDNLEYKIFGIPRPDKNILLYMPPEIGKRLVGRKEIRKYIGGKGRDIHEKDLQHLKDASNAYLYVAKKMKWTVIDCAPRKKLRTIKDISEELWNKVSRMIPKKR